MGKMKITDAISMKSVKELFGESFFIPNYQRGYRWERQQAEDLLNDIDAFIKKDKKEKEIYCLQPLVVSEDNNKYRVIDGQQRLTTIYLILSYLEKKNMVIPLTHHISAINPRSAVCIRTQRTRRRGRGGLCPRYRPTGASPQTPYLSRFKWCVKYITIKKNNIYTIEYDTRKGSSKFLKYFANNNKGEIKKSRNENVDYYHMALVYNTIEEWFEKHRGSKAAKEAFVNVLLNKVKLICYNISKTGSGEVSLDDEIGVFNRLNIGKIPLTDSELIKAMFLNRNNYEKNEEIESRQNKLANEWYEIEKVLQNDEFWLFIHSRYYYRPTRIDYILDLMSRSDAFGILGKIGEDAYDNASDDEKTTMLANIAYRKWQKDNDPEIKELIETDDYIKNIKLNIYDLVYKNNNNQYTECGEEIEAFLLKKKHKKYKEIYRSSKDEGKNDTLKERFITKLRDNKEDEFKAEVGEGHYKAKIQPMIDEFRNKLGEKLKIILKNEKEKDGNENTNKIYTALGEYIVNELTDDEHFIYRYFDKVFKDPNGKSSEELWKKVTDFFKIFTEWYNDYRLYHYIGYLAAVKGINAEDFMGLCVKEWNNNKDRQAFIDRLRDQIIEMIKKNSDKDSAYGKKFNYFRDLLDPKKKDVDADGKSFEEKLINTKFEENEYSKRCCVNILLLHNIETVIQYNDKLLNNAKYTAPYFSRFPFHLYNNERWDVEHVMPNANQINIEEERLIYILNAKKYYKNAELNSLIDEYISKVKPKYIRLDYNKLDAKLTELKSANDDTKKQKEDELKYYQKLENDKYSHNDAFTNICKKIEKIGDQALGDDHKNKALGDDRKNNIWNYTLLDSSTNREYGNHIFPYKRAYIAKKEEGIKLCIGVVGEEVAADKFQYHLEYRHENKNDIVKMLSAYSKANDLQEMIKEYINGIEDKEQNDIVKMLSAYSKAVDLKDKIEKYINGIKDKEQRVYENTTKGAKEAKKKIIDGIDDLKDKIKEYIIGIDKEQGVYENTNNGAKEAKKKFIDGIKGLVDKDLDPNKYMLVYLKNSDRGGNNGIQYKMVETYEEAPFVLQTTKNVFNKYYTEQVTTMLQWTKADAENYWNDMRTKLKYYFDELDKEMEKNMKNSKKKEGADEDE